MSEKNIYQIWSLNYYKKLKKWSTDDIDGDCFSFNLYRNTEISIVLLNKWRWHFSEKITPRFINNVFSEEISQIEWSITKKRNNGRPMKQLLKISNIISITVLNLIQIQNLDLSEYLLIDYPNLKDFRWFIFHWLEMEQIGKILIEVLNLNWVSKKNKKKAKKFHLFFFGVNFICSLC